MVRGGMHMGYTIDIDTGGTFTDGFFVRDERVELVKVPTTPHDLTVCFMECIKSGADRFEVPLEDLLYETDIIRFSNTIGTNTIIQRDGSRLGLLVSAANESLVPTWSEEGKPPLVLPDMVVGIQEEVSPTGEILKEPDQAAVMSAAQRLIDRGARCLVVSLRNSDINPRNERLIRSMIKKEYPRDFLGSVPVFLSSDISRRPGEAERVNAAVLNAYIHSKLVSLLYKAGEKLRQGLYRKSLFIVHNNNAIARVAKTRAINTYNSGPAAGLMGARLIGRLYGVENLLSADMGGTSFDLGYVRRGEPRYNLKPDVEGFAVNVPMVEIRAIGAGGGSIASVKEGVLRVGPRSAGALPGPVCFGLGGVEPTVTDADLLLGVLDPAYFLGGRMRLKPEAARAAIAEQIAAPMGLSVEEAAMAMKETIDASMGKELLKVKNALQEGDSPLLVVYGGAGPAHCCSLAKTAGIKKIVIVPFSAVFSAFSSSNMDVGHVYYARVDLPFREGGDISPVKEAVDAMRAEAERDMRGEGFSSDSMALNLDLFVKGAENGTEVKFSVPYGFYQDAGVPGEAVERARKLLGGKGSAYEGALRLNMVSLVAQAEVAHYRIREVPEARDGAEGALKGRRSVWVKRGEGPQEIPVYERSRITHGHRLCGPALVESEQTTVFVAPGWTMTVDRYNNAILEEVMKS
jgi:N-methylhydantoinase A/acetophenone carboxylase